MSIKYAEVTIIRNIEEESFFRGLFRSLGYENTTSNKDTIIITFDDETIYNVKDEYIDKKYEFGALGYDHWFPIHFVIKEKETTLFYKTPNIVNNIKRLNCQNIFKYDKNFYLNQLEDSDYNMIYQDINKNELFAIVRSRSNEEKPRFKIAYAENIFDKSDIIYLTTCILKRNFCK